MNGLLPIMYVKSVDMLKLLVEKGADIHAVDYEGRTLIMHKVLMDLRSFEYETNRVLTSVMGILVETEVSEEDDEVETIKQILLEKGVDIYAVDIKGVRNMHSVIELLVEKGVDINAVDNNGYSVLMIVAYKYGGLYSKDFSITRYKNLGGYHIYKLLKLGAKSNNIDITMLKHVIQNIKCFTHATK